MNIDNTFNKTQNNEKIIRIEIEKHMPYINNNNSSINNLRQHLTNLLKNRKEEKMKSFYSNMKSSIMTQDEEEYLKALIDRQSRKDIVIDSGIRLEMTNILNTQYIGKIYLGSPVSQQAKVIFDTGSNWLTVTSDLCEKCKDQAYSIKNSTSQQRIQEEKEHQVYGSAELQGYIYTDFVCLSPKQNILNQLNESKDNCVKDFYFIAITEVQGLNEGLQGILGMGPIKSSVPSLINTMMSNQIINNAIASFSLGNYSPLVNQPSYMIFGGLNKTQIVGDLKQFKLNSDNWWALNLKGLIYNNQIIDSFEDNGALAVIDTGTSMLAFPKLYYNIIVKQWENEIGNMNLIDCSQGICIGGLSCQNFEKILGNLTFQINDILFDIMPRGYLINASDLSPQFKNQCVFGIIKTPDVIGGTKMFLLGDVFLRNFYSVFDYQDNQISLGINLHSKDFVGIKNQDSITWLYLVVMVIQFTVCFFIFYVFKYKMKKEMNKRFDKKIDI